MIFYIFGFGTLGSALTSFVVDKKTFLKSCKKLKNKISVTKKGIFFKMNLP